MYCMIVLQLYPYECQERLVDAFTTGDDVTVDLTTDTLINHTTGEYGVWGIIVVYM